MSGAGAAHIAFLAALEQAGDLARPVCAFRMGRCGDEFVQRRWLRPAHAYLTRQMVSFLDGEIEVEVEIDEDAGMYRYRSPQWRSRILARPLSEIALYDFRVDAWLHDLGKWIGLEDPCPKDQTRIPGHLWHLGDFRVCKTTEPAPVLIARRLQVVSTETLSSVLTDPAWGRRGVVLTRERPDLPLPGVHEARAFSDFIGTPEGDDRFDSAAFVRVLRSLAAPSPVSEPEQFWDGHLLKLPHFDGVKSLADERAKIINEMWGSDGSPPPIKKWIEANEIANTGYSSFADAFDWDGLTWKDFFSRESHGKYRLRRNP